MVLGEAGWYSCEPCCLPRWHWRAVEPKTQIVVHIAMADQNQATVAINTTATDGVAVYRRHCFS